MKVMILADYEGVCGVRAYVDGPGSQFVEIEPSAQKQFINEINACIDGLRRGGADEIVVWNQYPGEKKAVVYLDDLRDGVYLIDSRDYAAPIIRCDASFDAVVHIGAFAMNHTKNGFKAHTIDDKVFDFVEYHGLPIGDLGLEVLSAGYFNVPTILVTGDDKACAEAETLCGKPLETVITKIGLARHKSMNNPPDEVCCEIAEKAEKALKNLSAFDVRKPEAPYEMKVRVMSQNFMASWFHMGYECAGDDQSVLLRGTDFIDLYAQLKHWNPGAHFKRFGITPETNDFLIPLSLN